MKWIGIVIIIIIVAGCGPVETYNMSDIRTRPIMFDEQYPFNVSVDLSQVLTEIEGKNSAKITCGNSYIKLLKKSLPSMFKKVTFKNQQDKKKTGYDILLVPSFSADFSADRINGVSGTSNAFYRIHNNIQYNITIIANNYETNFYSTGSNSDVKIFEESITDVDGVTKLLPYIYMGDISTSMLPSISSAFNDLLKKIYYSEELVNLQKTTKNPKNQPTKPVTEDEDVIDLK
jgi:hypothetical protein